MNAHKNVRRPGAAKGSSRQALHFRPVLFVASILTILILVGCVPTTVLPRSSRAGEPTIRVLLRENCSSVRLAATQSPLIRVSDSGTIRRLDLDPSASVALTLGPTGWRLSDIDLGTGTVQIDPAADGTLRVDGVAYHGRLRLIPRGQERFDLVNELGVENYLKGVLARELLRQWDAQTYQAQAVVARTYAIYETRSASAGADFDVYADQRSQMYGGMTGETEKARAAVDATAGTVVVAGPAGHEHIFKAYFCSCCGGIGQSAADAFGDEPSPELSEQSTGPLCCAAPFYNWGPIDISKAELTRRFRRFGQVRNRPEAGMALVHSIDVFADNSLGRPIRFVATGDDGRKFFWSGEELRWAVNTDATPATRLRSSLLKIADTGSTLRFTGHGFGHGVGMCQWTAQRRAELGMPYDQIVTLAFPTSKLVKAY